MRASHATAPTDIAEMLLSIMASGLALIEILSRLLVVRLSCNGCNGESSGNDKWKSHGNWGLKRVATIIASYYILLQL